MNYDHYVQLFLIRIVLKRAVIHYIYLRRIFFICMVQSFFQLTLSSNICKDFSYVFISNYYMFINETTVFRFIVC